MFDKEADLAETEMLIHCNGDYSKKKNYREGWQDGAEFGYNKGYHDAEEHYMNVIDSQHKLVEESKANEWHYMKDVNCYEDLPQNKDIYYAYVVNVGAYDKPTIERKLGCFAEFEFDVMAYHVIAWKEIVLPNIEEIKENDI